MHQLLAYHFMVNALWAGTIVALLAAPIGWFMVLRRQAFAGHTLSLIGFPGASGAALLGLAPATGYYAFCTAGALVLGVGAGRPRARSQETAAIGALQAFALACGFLFLSLYHGLLSDASALLFGTFFGISDSQLTALVAIATLSLALLAVIARPLLFASVDPVVARASGAPVRALSLAFFLLLGLAVAATSQITGSLLVFALLVMPAGTAHVITTRPVLGLVLSVVIALLVAWLGLATAFFSPYPAGFWITSLAFVPFVLAHLVRWAEAHRSAQPSRWRLRRA